MDTLRDYVKWMSDIDFAACPLKEADAVILTTLSYFDFAPLFAGGSDVFLRDMRTRLENGTAKTSITGPDDELKEIMDAAARSIRFGDLKIEQYVDELRNDPPFQFSAVTFVYQDRFRFIAYRGTDSSLAGWKEDFMISFTETEAQQAALRYAISAVIPGMVNYLAGHSKGGNEALYAACNLPDDLLSYVTHIYLLDSPGFCREVLDPRLVERIDRRTTRIIPEFDFVGKLYEPDVSYTKIVKSSLPHILQHASYSWLIDHGELATVSKCTEASEWLSKNVVDWIEELPMEDRPVMTEELFSALGSDGVTDLSELNLDTLTEAAVKLRGFSGSSWKNIANLPKKALFDDALDDVDKTKTKSFFGWFGSADWLIALIIITIGVAMFFISENILTVVSLVLSISAALVQLILTIRRLVKNRWKIDTIRERVYITVGLIAFVAILLIKENALFFLGSLIFGMLFLVLAYFSGVRGFKKTTPGFMKVLSVIECIIAILYGVSFLIIPSASVAAYAVSIAIALVIDGVIRLIYALIRAIRKRAEKKNTNQTQNQ